MITNAFSVRILSDPPHGGRRLRSLRGQSANAAWLQSRPSGSTFFKWSI